MVDVFGNNIVNAFTGGNPVKAIYSNGVKVWPNEDPIPEGYTQVECIYWDGVTSAPYLWIPMSDQNATKFKMVMDVDITRIPQNFIVGWKYGGTISSAPDVVSYVNEGRYTGTVLYCGGWNSTGYQTNFYYSDCGRGIMTYDLENYNVKWNGPERTVNLSTSKYSGSNINFYFFRSNIAGGYNSYNKIYDVKIMSNGSTIMHLVPVVNDTTGMAGLYDTLNHNFYSHTNVKYDELP